MFAIIGLIASALALGALVYLGYRLTVAVLKRYRKRQASKLLAAKVGDLVKKAPSIKLDDLDEDDVLMAEYDEARDELVQDVSYADDIDGRVNDIIDSNGGIVVLE